MKAKLVNGGRGHEVAKDGQGSNDDSFVNLEKKIDLLKKPTKPYLT